MKQQDGTDNASPKISRRQALKGTSIAAIASLATAATAVEYARATSPDAYGFYGIHQRGITTRQQSHLVFAVFDLTTTSKDELRQLLREWSVASERLMSAREIDGSSDPVYPPSDTGEATGLSAAGLTITVGFGPTLFDKRLGMTHLRPSALVDLPAFPGDQLDPLRRGGDICVQACSDDATVALHAVRNLARIALGALTLRSLQTGAGQTSSSSTAVATPRNLLGFKDGTNNLRVHDRHDMDAHVWVRAESDQSWMHAGTYLVMRRIRIHLEEWSSLPLETQQVTIGRVRASGAPLSGKREHDGIDFAKLDIFGAPVITANAHVRVASAHENAGAVILRRGYNFADGIDPRTGELNAGLLFICFQRDPRSQFVALQSNLASNDALSRYTTHVGSGIFACPPGPARGEFVGQHLFD